MSTSTPAMRRKAGIASFVGTTIEWYDFYIYGTAAALVLGPLFFPNASPAAGVLASFATFWVGFLARPIGGIVFGHLGDRLGRKNALVATLLLMGVSTLAIGLLPTYASIGVMAPVLLVVARLVQDLAVGGEWGGAVLIASEHASKGKRILYGAFAQQGSPAGQMLATGSFALAAMLPEEAFLSWGWRVPFLVSAALVVVGLVIRLRIEESPELVALRSTGRTSRFPLADLFRERAGMVVVAVGACALVAAAAYFKNTFALAWAVNDLGFDRQVFLNVVLISSFVQFCTQPLGAFMATWWNPRKVVTVLLLIELPLFPLMFALISTGNFALAALGMALAPLPHTMYYAILAGMLAEAFPARMRYTAISLSYALAGTLFGGTAPLIGQSLLAVTGSIVPVVVYSLVIVLVSLFAARFVLARGPVPDEVPAGVTTTTERTS
ncbi:permease of the major facilitator superfamily [Pseudonocardia sp. Ae168_Ps1]|uniref:MFS transporter n=1 Tax=unclassified Pseudonocardia TaxID=2619320 RepID=UPI00094B40E4|nr:MULTISPECIES: MFS transporter [unclassified Pseudonocardia]OLL73551.1 permease of the major facilitator superfamily [Pseudonocardia sp. Ae150A_Ps1]OLL79522.1 permease of the major facilitator superfamily [Pseudonocardia sp. Ae168_Ps1]OLL86337.1 permease of the major facilitator superfamily [Pseudonocardia sp. Ae263_Ps1]OLL93619.1 permease of the major facilitator superfamily [Pseudonocardia sp. Ae356_Ps1]